MEMEGMEHYAEMEERVLANLEEIYTANQLQIRALAKELEKQKIRQLNGDFSLKRAVKSLKALDVVMVNLGENKLKLNLPIEIEDQVLPEASAEMCSKLTKTLSDMTEGVGEFFKENKRESLEIVDIMSEGRMKLRELLDKKKKDQQQQRKDDVKSSTVSPPPRSDPPMVPLMPIENHVITTVAVAPKSILKRVISQSSGAEGERVIRRVMFAEELTQTKYFARWEPKDTDDDGEATPPKVRRSARLHSMELQKSENVGSQTDAVPKVRGKGRNLKLSSMNVSSSVTKDELILMK